MQALASNIWKAASKCATSHYTPLIPYRNVPLIPLDDRAPGMQAELIQLAIRSLTEEKDGVACCRFYCHPLLPTCGVPGVVHILRNQSVR